MKFFLLMILLFNNNSYSQDNSAFPDSWENPEKYNNYIFENTNTKNILEIKEIIQSNIPKTSRINISIKIANPIIKQVTSPISHNRYSQDRKIKISISDNKFKYPIKEEIRITSYYGPRKNPISNSGPCNNEIHTGIDFACNIGTKIYASKNGIVEFSGIKDKYGKVIIIKHLDGTKTIYAHCNVLLVIKNDYVEQNQQIARSGNTGRSTGPHLHFEIRTEDDIPINPLNLLEQN